MEKSVGLFFVYYSIYYTNTQNYSAGLTSNGLITQKLIQILSCFIPLML